MGNKQSPQIRRIGLPERAIAWQQVLIKVPVTHESPVRLWRLWNGEGVYLENWIEYNILCRRPFAKDIEDIQPLTLKEFCEAVGLSYNRTTVSRLKKAYSGIQFVVNGFPELFCAFVTDGQNHDGDKIIINPRILYSGRNPEQVRNLLQLMPKPHSHASVTTLRKGKKAPKPHSNVVNKVFSS